jgi:hypothetical protein
VGDVGGYFMGYYDVGANFVTGTAHMIAHPITTAQGVGYAATHLRATGNAIANGVAADWNGDARAHGRLVAGILTSVAAVLAPEAEAGNLSKVNGIANAGEKVEQTAAAVENSGNAAHNAADFAKLNKSLASQQQMGEAGEATAGAGGPAPFRNAGNAAQKYGGDPSDWAKMKSSSYGADGDKFRTHWIENTKTGQREEFKTKIGETPEK